MAYQDEYIKKSVQGDNEIFIFTKRVFFGVFLWFVFFCFFFVCLFFQQLKEHKYKLSLVVQILSDQSEAAAPNPVTPIWNQVPSSQDFHLVAVQYIDPLPSRRGIATRIDTYSGLTHAQLFTVLLPTPSSLNLLNVYSPSAYLIYNTASDQGTDLQQM